VLNILYSVLAGMVVMQEWKQVISWAGLLGASTSVLGGVVMLVSGPADKQDDSSSPLTGSNWRTDSELHEDHTLSALTRAATDSEIGAVGADNAEAMHCVLNDGAALHRAPSDGGGASELLRAPLPQESSAASMRAPFLVNQADCDNTPQSPHPPPGSDSAGGGGWKRSSSALSWRSQGSAERLHQRHSRRPSTYSPGSSQDDDNNPPGFFATLAQGLRPDMLQLNTAHREAAKVRRKWDRVKKHLRVMARPSSEGHLDSGHRFGVGILHSFRGFNSFTALNSFTKHHQAAVGGEVNGEVCYSPTGRANVDSAGASEDEDEGSDSGSETSSSGESTGATRGC